MSLSIQEKENCSPVQKEGEIYQSRWGYHPISKETYFKLKKLYKTVWLAWYAHKRLERYFRKKNLNRVGGIPETNKYLTLYTIKPWVENGMCQFLKRKEGGYGKKFYRETVLYVSDELDKLAFFNPVAIEVVESFWKVKKPFETEEEAKKALSELRLLGKSDFESKVFILFDEWKDSFLGV